MSDIKDVAIIMDGNGRWAKDKLRPRVFGHVKGVSVVPMIVEKANELKLNSLTLYAFSTENWSRPETEVQSLFKLLLKFLKRERKKIIENDIHFRIIGEIQNLPNETQAEIRNLEESTKNNQGLKLTFAFSYGGRREIVSSVNKFIKDNPGKEISEEKISSHLYQPEISEIDLLIRTGGDLRISNFLLWQISYAELYFTNTKWPDFSPEEFQNIIEQVKKNERRFGSLTQNSSYHESKLKAAESNNVKRND